MPSFDNLNNLSSSNMQQILNILQSNNDMSSCLSNCSNKGICVLNSPMQKYLCECNEYFTGVSCQTDTRPCARTNKCLNNGTCINSYNSTRAVRIK
jgi:hypothetical protein